MKKHTLFTAGYAGFDPETFLSKLRWSDVKVLVDVRDRPISRNRHFNQAPLKAFLEANQVEYISYRSLGVPAPLRQDHRAGGSLDQYFAAYRMHLAGQQEAMDSLYSLMTQKSCCLLCLERNPLECHRSVLAEVLSHQNGNQIEVVHL